MKPGISDSAKMAHEFPALNVVVHNAGIMRPENVQGQSDYLADAEAIVAINLNEFITEVMQILTDQRSVTEVVVERCKPLRFAAEAGNVDAMFQGLNQEN